MAQMSARMGDERKLSSQQDVSRQEEPRKLTGLTPRVIIMLIVVTLFANWIALGSPNDGLGYLTHVDAIGLPSSVGMFVLLVLSIISFKLKPLARRLKLDFTRAELMTLYICSGFIYLMSTGQFALNVIGVMATFPFRAIWDPNAYAHTGSISRLLFPWDATALDNFMFGEGPLMWSVWIRPLLLWFLFFGAIFFLLYSISTVLYSRWRDVERLPFPLVTPVVKLAESLEGTAGKEYSLRNIIFVVGLVIPVLLKLPNILNGFFPGVPTISLSWNLAEYVTEGALGASFGVSPGTWIRIYPYAVGIGYLVPTDFTFSIWFSFYIWQRLIVYPILASAGIPLATHYYGMQFSGGILVYGIILVWLARGYIKDFVRAAFGRSPWDPQVQPMHPKLLFFGTVLSIIVVLGLGTALLGIQFHIMVFYLLTFLAVATVHARFRAEPGLPFCQMPSGSVRTLESLFGSSTNVFNEASRVGLMYIDIWTVWSVPSTSAWVMEGLKIADDTGMKRKSMLKAFGISILLVFIVTFPLAIKVFHSSGFAFNVGGSVGNAVPTAVLAKPRDMSPVLYGKLFWLLGAVITILCTYMRLNFVWWPLHPWGYLLGHQMDVIYRFPGAFFIAWLIKVLIFRWFGKNTYDKLVPLFVGLILSDVIMGVIQSLISSLRVFMAV